MTDLEGRVALVTGASRGIGAACAHLLALRGARVFTAQRQATPDHETLHADLRDPEAPAKIIRQIEAEAGQLDILVNNAGVMLEGDVTETSLSDWALTLQVNLTAPFLLIRSAMPMLEATRGSIVNIGSIEGLGSNPRHPAYCASKGGLHALTRAVAVDHGPQGVRCNAVAPGWIDTELNVDFIESLGDPEAFREQIGRIHPLRRAGAPEEVAELVVWLASDKAAFVTGQVWTMDGGRMCQLSLP